MDGPSHYRAAERLLAGEPHPDGGVVMLDAERIAKAQVHATLAMVAATVDIDLLQSWQGVVGGTTPDGAA